RPAWQFRCKSFAPSLLIQRSQLLRIPPGPRNERLVLGQIRQISESRRTRLQLRNPATLEEICKKEGRRLLIPLLLISISFAGISAASNRPAAHPHRLSGNKSDTIEEQ